MPSDVKTKAVVLYSARNATNVLRIGLKNTNLPSVFGKLVARRQASRARADDHNPIPADHFVVWNESRDLVTAYPSVQFSNCRSVAVRSLRNVLFVYRDSVSPSDRMKEMQERIDDHLKVGVRYVWLLHSRTRRAFVYTLDTVQEV